MMITVIAMNEGFAGAYKAGRFFPNGEEVTLEVLEADDDPPKVKAPDGKTEVPDPKKVGKTSFEAIKKDPRLKVLADRATQGVLSKAAYDEAKGSAEKAGAELIGARLEVSRLTDENAQLKARLAELEKQQPPPSTSTPGATGGTGATSAGDDRTEPGGHPKKSGK
jgi:hypothetical protein